MNTMPTTPRSPRNAQRGVVLVISLLLLLVLTLIGVAATRSTTLEERMTANQRDREVAFQAAEAALRDGESALQAASPGQFDNTNGLYDQSTTTVTWQTADWSNTSTGTIVYSGTLDPQPASPPRYYLIQTTSTAAATGQSLAADQPTTGSSIYQVIARGVGLSGNTVVVLESAYKR